MLNRVSLRHFKCFDSLELPLGRLTLLTGFNASGKSTVLQGLLLLYQTVLENEWSRELLLRGPVVSMGALGDVIDQVGGGREFSLGLASEDSECLWTFRGEDRTALSVPVAEVHFTSAQGDDRRFAVPAETAPLRWFLPDALYQTNAEAQSLTKALLRLNYVSAERSGPRETYPLGAWKQPTGVGPQGEHAPGVLYRHADAAVSERLRVEDAPPTLIRQAEAWMQYFFPGAAIAVEPVRNASLVTLGLRTRQDTDFHRPQNVGYGLTQILPILTACLAAEPGDLVVVDSPEAHLHPAAQAQMARFLALTASTGVQVLMESHSDHVLNGIRRAVRKNEIRWEDTTIHFFTDRGDQGEKARAHVISPSLQPDGSLDLWPHGFFDQYEKDTSYFAGWSDETA